MGHDKLARVNGLARAITEEVGRAFIGSPTITETLLTALLARGHVLIEGYPGVAKTTLVKAFSQTLGCNFRRIQFTPDLLPSDITGTYILDMRTNTFVLREGPVFTNVLLGDEINRAPAKTQSALLEAMQEQQVTIEGETRSLGEPFIVLATQNPIEQEGTYPLPEAQLDRFFFKLLLNYSGREELSVILDRTTRGEWPTVSKVMDGNEILQWQQLVREVLVAPPVQDYAIRLVLATHPQGDFAAAETNKFIRCGASPRGGQALVLAGKVRALLEGRYNVSFEDIRRVYMPALRHRILLNFEAQAENIPSDAVLEQVLKEVKEKGPEMASAVRA